MSSELTTPVPVPRTGVPIGITDPVERARVELKATLAAIEQKANVPRRVTRASARARRTAREFAESSPVAATAIVAAGAAIVGTAVWAVIRLYTR